MPIAESALLSRPHGQAYASASDARRKSGAMRKLWWSAAMVDLQAQVSHQESQPREQARQRLRRAFLSARCPATIRPPNHALQPTPFRRGNRADFGSILDGKVFPVYHGGAAECWRWATALPTLSR
jgi:hypothetical protein